jgi:GNAT superfamily N-acetyltransferase
LKTFIRLPSRLPDRRSNYVPPLWRDEDAYHDPDRNVAAANCRIVRFLAEDQGRVLGRVMGIVHDAYGALHGERTVRFSQLDCVPDASVAKALLGAVEDWGRSLGMDRIIGPFGFSDKDPQGMQVEGFEHLPVLATATNPAYLPGLVEEQGYAKLTDAVVYRLDIPHELPAAYRRISGRLLGRGRFRLVPLQTKRELKPWVLPVLRLVNGTYNDLLGFIPMTEAEMRDLAAHYIPVLDPKLVKLVIDERGEPAAFVVALPDMSEGLVRAGGRLFPFGFLHILLAMRRSRQLDLLLGAVERKYQGLGLTCVLGVALLAEARDRGMTCLDSHLILETNLRMRAELERLGATVWKRYRIYQKPL